MKIHFHTNLDLAQHDVFLLNQNIGTQSIIPRIGEFVVFPFNKWDRDLEKNMDYNYSLEVVGIRYNYFNSTISVDLHIERFLKLSIGEWAEWFRKFRLGKGW